MATFGTGEFFASTNGGAYVYRFTSEARAKQAQRAPRLHQVSVERLRPRDNLVERPDGSEEEIPF